VLRHHQHHHGAGAAAPRRLRGLQRGASHSRPGDRYARRRGAWISGGLCGPRLELGRRAQPGHAQRRGDRKGSRSWPGRTWGWLSPQARRPSTAAAWLPSSARGCWAPSWRALSTTRRRRGGDQAVAPQSLRSHGPVGEAWLLGGDFNTLASCVSAWLADSGVLACVLAPVDREVGDALADAPMPIDFFVDTLRCCTFLSRRA
jgi:hypothetical protein